VLRQLLVKIANSRLAALKSYCLLGGILGLGIFDQTATGVAFRSQPVVQAEYQQDAEFVKQIEACLPPNSLVFELPYHAFPEAWPIHHLGGYELARPYLHSHQLRWSYGAMKGRDADLWQHQVADCPTDTLVKKLAYAGFGGIYIDRRGFPDVGVML